MRVKQPYPSKSERGGSDADGDGGGLAFDRADQDLGAADEGVDGQRLRSAGGITRSATGAGTRAKGRGALSIPELRVTVTPAEELGVGDAHFERGLVRPHINHDDVLSVTCELSLVGLEDDLAGLESRLFGVAGGFQFAFAFAGP